MGWILLCLPSFVDPLCLRPLERNWVRPASPECTSDASANRTTQSTSVIQGKSQYGDHEPHPNCPDTLTCLPDTDGRPQHTLPVILRCAILGSAKKRLTIREIYAAMEGKYAYFRSAGPTWKVRLIALSESPYPYLFPSAIRPSPFVLEQAIRATTSPGY